MDRRASEEFGVSTLELMERAGLALHQAARRMLRARLRGRDPRGAAVLILCGKGNNGGDGLVLARLLKREGVDPEVWLVGAADGLRGDAQANYERARAAGVRIREVVSPEGSLQPGALAASSSEPPPLAPEQADLVVDALLGTGLHSDVEGPAADLVRWVNQSRGEEPARRAFARPRVLSVDIPSGLDSDTGRPRGVAVRADETVTFALPKVGLALYPGRELAGRLTVADIGIPPPLLEADDLTGRLTTAADVFGMLPPLEATSHKGRRGKVLVVAGAEGYTGAAALTAEACFRVGAGLVLLACPSGLNDIYEAKLTEVITLPVPEGEGRTFCPDACEPILEELAKSQALVIGPGLTRKEKVAAFIEKLLPQVQTPTLLDADGLNLLSERGFALPPQCVITPHPGEMSRLLCISTKEVQADRIGAACEAARRFGCVALLKGGDTVVATPEGQYWINTTGNSGLASAGTGDVLSGTIGGLLGRGLPPLHAAVAGAYLHGLAADLVAEDLGTEGMMAGDVLRALPRALKRTREQGTDPRRDTLYPVIGSA